MTGCARQASTPGRVSTLDLAALADRFAPLLPAGFYYKTFMAPARLWRTVWEPLLRHMAGLGRAPASPDPARYDKRHEHCDVLVVGGGPAGLAAALAAGRRGARVILADSDIEFGGGLLRRPAQIGDARWHRLDARARLRNSQRCRRCGCCAKRPCSAVTTTIT